MVWVMSEAPRNGGSVIDRAYGMVSRAGGHLGCRALRLRSWAGYSGRDAGVRWAGQGKGSLIFTFACFLIATAGVYFLGGGDWALGSTQI